MHFDWFFPVLMIYWRTKAQVTSPSTSFASSLNKTNTFHVAAADCTVINYRGSKNVLSTSVTYSTAPSLF